MAQQEPAPIQRRSGRVGTIVTAVLAGVAGGLVAPLILPRLERNFRPATKSLFKTGIALYERGRERAAEMGEFASDMMAEARAEYDAEQSAGVAEDNTVAANEFVRRRTGHARRLARRMPSPPAARISHFTPRRLRIKVPEKRRDRGFFDTVAERLATWESVERVETNPLTASVLIHFSDPERLFLEAAVKNDLFDIDFDSAFGDSD